MLNDELIVTVSDTTTGRKVQKYARRQVLGHGGFARCYTMINLLTGQKFAGKVIKKKQLKDKQSREKILQQIQIHKSLNNQNICQFIEMFEYQQDIYIVLQLCQNNSLKEFLKKRVRITEFEAKYYLRQIINGLDYLHRINILHRDIKLGNVFLNYKMQVKIGDFGLSTVMKGHRDRRFTTCGTPNYIAPEILNETGHGFEVDIWAVGIMLYALVVGKPPFQADTVENTYKRIKDNAFAFPKEIPLTPQCKNIIKNLLEPNPKHRITLQHLRTHQFLTSTNIPLSLPPYTISIPPQNSFLKQYGCNQKAMKLTILPQFEQSRGGSKLFSTITTKGNNINTSKHNENNKNKLMDYKKMSRVLSLDKQLFKTSRLLQPTSSNDQKSTLNRCHIYNSGCRIQSQFNSQRKRGLYGSVRNIHLSGQNRLNQALNKKQLQNKGNKQGDVCQIICYFDMQEKYGMGYLLSNGNYGVVFNDKTSLTRLVGIGVDDSLLMTTTTAKQSHQQQKHQHLSPQSFMQFQYIYYNRQQTKLSTLPDQLKKKQTILQMVYSKLKKYKNDNIPVTFQSFTFVKKIVNCEDFFMLKLSNDILQFFWSADTIILRSQKWIRWKIGKFDGESVVANSSLPHQVKIKLDQIKAFLVKYSSSNRDTKT